MSHSQIDAFHAQLQANPELFRQLMHGVDSAEAFIERAISEAKAQGYHFDKQELCTWIEHITVPEASELSDTQLEAVAGGKGEATEALRKAMNMTHQDLKKAWEQVSKKLENFTYEPPPWQ